MAPPSEAHLARAREALEHHRQEGQQVDYRGKVVQRGRAIILPERFLRLPIHVRRYTRALAKPTIVQALHKRDLMSPRDAEAALTIALLGEFRWRWWHTDTLTTSSSSFSSSFTALSSSSTNRRRQRRAPFSLLAIRVIRTPEDKGGTLGLNLGSRLWSNAPTRCRIWVHDLRSDAQCEVKPTAVYPTPEIDLS